MGGASLLFTRESQPTTTYELGDVVYAREENDKSAEGPDNAVGFDFGIVEIPQNLEEYVDPSMPVWGGPITTDRFDDVGTSEVLQYGNGVGAGETIATKNRAGTAAFNFSREGDQDNSASQAYKNSSEGTYSAWYASLPAAPGDSGSAVQTPRFTGTGPEGYGAAGILTHLAIAAGIRTRPAVGVGTTAGTNVREAKTMVREDTRRVLNYEEGNEDPFGRPAKSPGFGSEGEVDVTNGTPDAYTRLEGNNEADVLIDDERLIKAASWLEDKGITESIELEVMTPDRWEFEQQD